MEPEETPIDWLVDYSISVVACVFTTPPTRVGVLSTEITKSRVSFATQVMAMINELHSVTVRVRRA